MLRSWRWILFLLLVAATLYYHAPLRLGVLSGLFLWDLLLENAGPQQSEGALASITPSPTVNGVRIESDGRFFAADIYTIKDGTRRAGIVLTHGIIESGKDDPRLVRFARALARSGFVVLVPELKGMKSFRILLSDTDDIVQAFLALADLDAVDDTKIGLLGFSYGAGPTMMAAARPSIRDRVKFVVSFGGYYDPVNVIRFITTGFFEYRGERGFIEPQVYGKWIFFMNNADYVESETDKRVLKEIFTKESKNLKQEAARLVPGLTSRGRMLYELLNSRDPARIDELIGQTDANFRGYLKKISMAAVAPFLKAYLIIGHGSTDPLIPYTESLRLADAVPDQNRVHLAILRAYSHVDPSKERLGIIEWVTIYAPSLLRFYFLVYDLLRQQR